LQINLRERVQTSLVDTISQRATAGSVVMDADYKLTAIDGGAPIISGAAFTFSSYDRTSQRFANIRAARDAEIRDAKILAEQIKTRISAALVK
jgi:LPS-assembly lipoprotein